MSQAKKTRRQTLEELLAANPGHPFARYGLAMECLNEGEDEAAGDQFRQLLALHPSYLAAYYQYGMLLKRLGRMAESMEILRTGIELARKLGDSHAGSELQAALDELAHASREPS